MKHFPDNLEYNYATSFKKELREMLDSGESIYLDLENVERASLACIQILFAACKKAEKNKTGLLIKSSQTLHEMLCDLGLESSIQTERVS